MEARGELRRVATPMPRIKIGAVGCGLIAQMMHLPHLRELEDREKASTFVRAWRAAYILLCTPAPWAKPISLGVP